MSKRIDGWCAWSELFGWGVSTLAPTQELCIKKIHGKDIPIKPVRIIDADAWDKLIGWCEMMAKAHRRSLETLNCDDTLNGILEEVEG